MPSQMVSDVRSVKIAQFAGAFSDLNASILRPYCHYPLETLSLKEKKMPRRLRARDRLFWSHWGYCGWHHPHWGPWGPPPWWAERPTEEEEKEDLKEHVALLKEELKAAEERIKELEKGK